MDVAVGTRSNLQLPIALFNEDARHERPAIDRSMRRASAVRGLKFDLAADQRLSETFRGTVRVTT